MTDQAVKALRSALHDAVDSEAVVTVRLDNSRTFTGTVMEHPTLADGYYFVVPATASRERPAAFHKLDVAEVIFE